MHSLIRVAGAFLLLVSTSSLFGQANDFIDSVIAKDALSVSEAAYLVLVASDNLGDDADSSRAFEMIKQLGWDPVGFQPDAGINYGEFSYMLIKAFGVRTGLLFSLFPGPHYAYRELVHLVVVQGATDPDMKVSGTGAMHMLSRIFDVKGLK